MHIMKHFLLVILLISFSNSIVQAKFAGGSGTEEDPWHVETIDQLQEIRNHTDRHFIQVNDIDAGEAVAWNDSLGFQPIGVPGYPFSGTYDGAGFIISDLTIVYCPVCPALAYAGLFGRVENGRIINTRLQNLHITGLNRVGGLVGYNAGEIRNSSVTGVISGRIYVGGLVGWNTGSIINSFATCDVSGYDNVGGLVGYNENEGKISDSYALGFVTGENEVGGLAGVNVGNGLVSTSYASGKVKGSLYVGGLIGLNTANIVSSYWDRESSQQNNGVGWGNPDGITSLTTSQMTGLSAFENMSVLDFDKIWLLTEEYPALYWEDVDALDLPTSADNEVLPATLELRQNYPNPFNPTTQIGYAVPEPTNVRLDVYNALGQQVVTLVNKYKSPGVYEVSFDATTLPSGAYLYRLQTESQTKSRQMLLMK